MKVCFSAYELDLRMTSFISIDVFLNGDALCRILQNHEKTKKNPVAKCYPQWELNPGPLTFMLCMLSELIPYLLEVSYLWILTVLILGLREFFGINRSDYK